MDQEGALERLTSLRQYQGDGKRAPHKPLLVLLALGQFVETGSSALSWSVVEARMQQLLAEFGPPSSARSGSAAYPFTRLRADGVWHLSRDVPNDNVGPLAISPIEGSFTSDIEEELRRDPAAVARVARRVVEQQFPMTLAPDVLMAVGLDAEIVLTDPTVLRAADAKRRRDPNWRRAVIEAWDRSCAFCGYDGAVAGAPAGPEAAHVRWFNFGGPDELDNGLALCSLHHKLLDRGALGLREDQAITVSSSFSASSDAARAVYDLHGRHLRPRPGTRLPSSEYIAWHTTEVFKGEPLTA
jgi:putative restriction endonuclease